MLGKIVSGYQKFQMDLVGKLANGSSNIIEEAPFFDEGYISTQIERLKLQHEDLLRELKISLDNSVETEYEITKRKTLKLNLDRIELKIIHFASNSFQSLDLCEKLMQGKQCEIAIAVKGLREYQKNNEEKAILCLKDYFSNHSVTAGYFLINKTYAKLLMKQGELLGALKHLEYAAQLRIDDVEVLYSLKTIYRQLGYETEDLVVTEVMELLG